jgi:hypothetical protein
VDAIQIAERISFDTPNEPDPSRSAEPDEVVKRKKKPRQSNILDGNICRPESTLQLVSHPVISRGKSCVSGTSRLITVVVSLTSGISGVSADEKHLPSVLESGFCILGVRSVVLCDV